MFDPRTNQWTPLPAMPKPRSSHDVMVVGDQLIVIGGWNLPGNSDDARWATEALILDLPANNPQWHSAAQPFQRRAFMAAAWDGKVYVLGGMTPSSEPTTKVEVYDPKSKAWTDGPDLPSPDKNGFGAAACMMNEKLYVSVADGTLYRLNDAGKAWDKVGAATPRIVHRLAASNGQILVLGGASGQKQLDLIEAVDVKSGQVIAHSTTQPSHVATAPGSP